MSNKSYGVLLGAASALRGFAMVNVIAAFVLIILGRAVWDDGSSHFRWIMAGLVACLFQSAVLFAASEFLRLSVDVAHDVHAIRETMDKGLREPQKPPAVQTVPPAKH